MLALNKNQKTACITGVCAGILAALAAALLYQRRAVSQTEEIDTFTPIETLEEWPSPTVAPTNTADASSLEAQAPESIPAEEFEAATSLVGAGTPLADFLLAAYRTQSPERWKSARRLIDMYAEMKASPEDPQTSIPLAAEGQRILQSEPSLAGSNLWPIECRQAMCVVQISETPNGPPGQGGGSSGLIKAVMSWGGVELRSEDDLNSGAETFGFGEVRLIHGGAQTFVFLRRKASHKEN